MAASTGPVLLTGTITFFNDWANKDFAPSGIDLKIPVATFLAAGGLALLEHVSQPLAVGIAWISFVTSLLLTPKSGNSPVANITKLTGL